MPNYYDRVLEDYGEAVLDDAFDEAFDDAYDEDLGEARGKKRPGGAKLPGSVGRASNFGKNIPPSGGSGNFVTKAELKNSLNSISQSVNDLKKSSLSLAGSIKKLDDGYDKIIRGVAKKDKAQDSVMNNSVLMTMMGTLINKPVLDPSALTIVNNADGSTADVHIADNNAAEASVSIDPVKTMLFAMLPTMMNGSGSGSDNSNMMMMMLMVMLMAGNGGGSLLGGSGGDTTLVMVMMMMMMMGKK